MASLKRRTILNKLTLMPRGICTQHVIVKVPCGAICSLPSISWEPVIKLPLKFLNYYLCGGLPCPPTCFGAYERRGELVADCREDNANSHVGWLFAQAQTIATFCDYHLPATKGGCLPRPPQGLLLLLLPFLPFGAYKKQMQKILSLPFPVPLK